jgi:hypothetical protein
MSVALAAQKLLYDADGLSDPYNNALYQAWVLDIDIDGLLAFQKNEASDSSIFSSDRIPTLVSEYLTLRYRKKPIPAPGTHPAVSPNKCLKLGLALSNLNGIDYGRRTLAGGEFIYSRFEDEYCRSLTLDDDNESIWEAIAQVAVASGAFPFAFRPENVQRERSEFSNPAIITADLGPDPLTFAYTDGGVFQNEPLGLAKNCVDQIDCHLNSDSRAYLFIAPDMKVSTADRSFNAKLANFRAMLSRLSRVIMYQSRFQDWICAEQVNEQIDLFNTRASQLQSLVSRGVLAPSAINALVPVLLNQFFPVQTDLENARNQLRIQFRAEYEQLINTPSAGKDGADAWIDAILVLEMAANLHEKDEMFIYTITADSRELAGAQLMGFLGFFDEKYRQHDYDIGRTKAQAALTGLTGQQKGPLPALRYGPLPIRPIDGKLAGAHITDAPLAKRKALRDRLRNRATTMLAEANVPLLVRKPVQWLYVDRKINEFLGL